VRKGRLETIEDREEGRGRTNADGKADIKNEKHVHESERDGKYRCDEMTNQDDDSLNERNYNLKNHMDGAIVQLMSIVRMK
jgi:hypothetical protein